MPGSDATSTLLGNVPHVMRFLGSSDTALEEALAGETLVGVTNLICMGLHVLSASSSQHVAHCDYTWQSSSLTV